MNKEGIVLKQDEKETVIAVLNDDSEGKSCESCSLSGLCTPVRSGKPKIRLEGYGSKRMPKLSEGQGVRIRMTEGRSVWLSFLLFLMPLFVIFGVQQTLVKFGLHEGLSILFGLIGGAVYFAAVLLLEKKLLRKIKVFPIE